MERVFAKIRQEIRSIAKVERQALVDGLHQSQNDHRVKDINRLRQQRLAELQELLLGPAMRQAERDGWADETVEVRVTELFNAVNAATRWDRWNTYYRDFLDMDKYFGRCA